MISTIEECATVYSIPFVHSNVQANTFGDDLLKAGGDAGELWQREFRRAPAPPEEI